MQTLKQFIEKHESVPAATAWYLTDLSEAKGRQELFTKQSPQKLKILREHAMIESAVSSNRIEGITADQSRIATIVFGRSALRDRSEEEIRGYRDALNKIHSLGAKLPVSENSIKELHKLTRGEIWDAGKYKEKDGDIIEKFPDGRSRIRFKTVEVVKTPSYMGELIELYHDSVKERIVHPLVVLAAFNLDFLCVHPFRDGNGRVSRLLLLLQCYHFGYEAGRYISLERLIEENKERYYETLEKSSFGWHEGKHDPWPYINYILYILKAAYREFEDRVGSTKTPKGAKTELIEAAINKFDGEFTMRELERACPDASRDMIKKILCDLKKTNKVKCLGKGPGTKWLKRGNI